jgi:hypothetical protein
MNWKTLKGANLASFKILPQNLPGGTEERYKIISQHIRSSDSGSNTGLQVKYISEVRMTPYRVDVILNENGYKE